MADATLTTGFPDNTMAQKELCSKASIVSAVSWDVRPWADRCGRLVFGRFVLGGLVSGGWAWSR